MMVNVNLKVNNISDYAKDKRYIVCTLVRGELWYYGATNEAETAIEMEQDAPNRLTLEGAKYER